MTNILGQEDSYESYGMKEKEKLSLKISLYDDPEIRMWDFFED